jgi:diguanylate cyclase
MRNVLGMARYAQARKRRVYLMLLGLAALGTLLALAVELADGRADGSVVIPSIITLVLSAALAYLARNPRVSLTTVEVAIFGAFTAAVLGNLAHGFYLGDVGSGALETARVVLHWVPALFIFAYIAFGRDWAGWSSFGVFMAVVAITAPAVFLGDAWSAHAPHAAATLVQIYLAHVVVLVALSFFAGVQQRLAAWQDAAQEMRLMALTDALTGLANRRWGEEQLEQELLRAARYGRGFAVILLDIDRFKLLNDTHGHAAGDGVLVDLAQRLRRLLRATDHVVRWGGEEFLILAPETRLDAALELAASLRERVAAESIGGGHAVTISLGVATYHPGDVSASLIERADAALYRAKRGGRDRVESEWPPAPSGGGTLPR